MGIIVPKRIKSESGDSMVTLVTLHPDFYPPRLPPTPTPVLWKEKKKTSGDDSDYLAEWYEVKPSGKLWEFCDRIGQYRREGKNRRDTATVATRVLRLSRMSAMWSFDIGGKKKPVPIKVNSRL